MKQERKAKRAPTIKPPRDTNGRFAGRSASAVDAGEAVAAVGKAAAVGSTRRLPAGKGSQEKDAPAGAGRKGSGVARAKRAAQTGDRAEAQARPPSPAGGEKASRARRTAKPAKQGAATERKAMTRWTAASQKLFLDTLAETANVRHAAAVADCSSTHIYRLRQESEDFRAKWAAALREGYAVLEVTLLERALNGVRKTGATPGKTGAVTEFNDRTGLALLSLHRGARHGAAEPRVATSVATRRKELAARLSEMNRRMGGAG